MQAPCECECARACACTAVCVRMWCVHSCGRVCNKDTRVECTVGARATRARVFPHAVCVCVCVCERARGSECKTQRAWRGAGRVLQGVCTPDLRAKPCATGMNVCQCHQRVRRLPRLCLRQQRAGAPGPGLSESRALLSTEIFIPAGFAAPPCPNAFFLFCCRACR